MKKPSIMAVLLFLTVLLCIVSLFFFTKSTTEQIIATEKDVDTVTEQITAKQKEFQTAQEKYTAAVDEVQNNINYLKQKAQTASQKQEKEKADISEEETTSKPSVFSQADASEPDNFSADNGHVVGIDPGHQGENVDMSAPEPIGPGSSEMKAKCTSGTRGSFTGIPEYQLNLNVSLQLKDVLEQRGYRVVMTRTDNDTAISNKERAEYAASQGSEIYVRIHANGTDSSSASGALAMAPSQSNPYVSSLFDQSNRLSQCILDSYCQATGFQNLGIQYTDTMTGINWSTVPVTILEMGFMTNQNDDTKMNDSQFQQTMVEGIANGIDAYFASV